MSVKLQVHQRVVDDVGGDIEATKMTLMIEQPVKIYQTIGPHESFSQSGSEAGVKNIGANVGVFRVQIDFPTIVNGMNLSEIDR